ncbi:MAG: hypothetical protein ACLFVU_15265 [Phycisphaerae bacterium]
MSQVKRALETLARLGSPDDIQNLASDGFAPTDRPAVNAHIHLPPNFSAFEQVSQAVELAAEQDVKVVGVSNYYDFTVYGDFAAQASRRGIFPLFGLELIAMRDDLRESGVKINDPGNPGKMYICGKAITKFDTTTSRARELMQTIRDNDSRRMAEMIMKVETIFTNAGVKTGMDADAVKEMIVLRHGSDPDTVYIQERHIAQAFQTVLFDKVPAEQRKERLAEILGTEPAAEADDAVAIQGEIRSHLMKAGKPAFVPEAFVSFNEAKELILQLGGIPCYPTLADGKTPICDFEDPAGELVDTLKQSGIHLAELIPIRNTPDVLTEYVTTMRSNGLAVVGGTEHNTLDLLPIEPACVGGTPVPEQVKEIFWEGACVVAAHQFLTLNGRAGFVDADGNPNPDHDSADQRIKAFASLGAAVIRKYFESNN